MGADALPCVKQTAEGNLLDDSGSSNPVRCEDPEGRDGEAASRGTEHMYT